MGGGIEKEERGREKREKRSEKNKKIKKKRRREEKERDPGRERDQLGCMLKPKQSALSERLFVEIRTCSDEFGGSLPGARRLRLPAMTGPRRCAVVGSGDQTRGEAVAGIERCDWPTRGRAARLPELRGTDCHRQSAPSTQGKCTEPDIFLRQVH